MDFAILGFGNRGQMFADFIAEDKDARLVAVCDVSAAARLAAKKKYKAENIYSDAESFFAAGKQADALFICTQDKEHRAHAVAAMKAGYDICLEKPVATTWEDCLEIYRVQKETGRKVMVCHVLRYSHFYAAVREVIRSGRIGQPVTFNQTENVGYWHDAHSYVRGAWRNRAESCPMILAKCSHDLDILTWLVGKRCVSVSSYGSLYYFRGENAPKGSTAYCTDCPASVRSDCPYDAYKIYLDIYKAYNPVLGNMFIEKGTREETIKKILDERGAFSRCVFRCDNDVVDHQVVNMLLEDGVTAHLTMTAFSKDCHRTLAVHGTLGEIFGDMEENKIYLRSFNASDEIIDLTERFDDFSVHGGGDKALYYDFKQYLSGGENTYTRTTLQDSLAAHEIAFAAESSRLAEGEAKKLTWEI